MVLGRSMARMLRLLMPVLLLVCGSAVAGVALCSWGAPFWPTLVVLTVVVIGATELIHRKYSPDDDD